MKPYYQDSAVTIYHGDCREILPGLGKFDLLLTDPPYGIGELMKGGKNTGHWNMLSGGNAWDGKAPDLAGWFESATHKVIWGGNYFPLPPSRCWLAWIKSNAVPTQSDMELAWTNLEMPSRAVELPSGGAYKRQHPTQKPEQLITWCLRECFHHPDRTVETVVDPFCGSGTVSRACKDLGYKSVSIELEEAYCEIAAKRMAQEVLAL